MSDQPATLTYALRELVWSIESELAVYANLVRRIDDHVTELNGLRAELAERLRRLDLLRASTHDPHLTAYLTGAVVAPLPQRHEDLPERLSRS